MPISRARATRHVEEETIRLAKAGGRSNWPKHLYHTTHVDNAVSILRAGTLSCRNGAPCGFVDVANQDVLAIFPGSHDFARLYFRPKNGFHLRTEGIKCLDDQFRIANHNSIPITLRFDAISVLSAEEAHFTAGNAQKTNTFPLMADEQGFNTIDFNVTYHDSPLKQGDDKTFIHERRQAEVLMPKALPLEGHLVDVLCRTHWDASTLVHRGGRDLPYIDRIRIDQTSDNYMGWGLYLVDVGHVGESLRLRFHLPRCPPQNGLYRVDIKQLKKSATLRTWSQNIALTPQGLNIPGFVAESGTYWEVHLEGALAFFGGVPFAASQVFA